MDSLFPYEMSRLPVILGLVPGISFLSGSGYRGWA